MLKYPQKWQNPERGFNHLRLWESFILKVVKIQDFACLIDLTYAKDYIKYSESMNLEQILLIYLHKIND